MPKPNTTSTTTVKNLQPVPISDYDLITQTFTKYTDGLRRGDIPLVQSAFHPAATMYGFNLTGTLFGGPISNLWAFLELHGAAPNIRVRTDVVGITPTTAVVKVEMERDAAGFDYTDFCTLVKMEEGWRIVGKTFHMYAA